MIVFEVFYLLGVKAYGLGIFIFSFFNKKAKQWIDGRSGNFALIRKSKKPGEKRIWFHCSSLGEFEQGRPVLEAVRKEYPEHKIVLTFFSPSGYEIRKNYEFADYVFYMPLDGPYNSLLFINLIMPEMAIFVKYDFWHYYIKILKDKKIPTYFISCNFRPSQIYFKWYGFFFEKILRRVSHLFVQNQSSLELLYRNSIPSVTVSGDTRFDRVYENSQIKRDIPYIGKFKGNQKLFIAGSTWPEDLLLLTSLINENKYNFKWIIAPHEIHPEQIQEFRQSLRVTNSCYSEIDKDINLEDLQVIIIDSVGILAGLYSYADVAWIGGGFKKGIHNILEAAVFGVPVLFGPRYDKFQEARELINRKGAFSIRNKGEFETILDHILSYPEELARIKQVNIGYIMENKGATAIIINFLKMNHLNFLLWFFLFC